MGCCGGYLRPKIEHVIGERRRIHNEELRHLCYSPNMRKTGWTGHVARMEERCVGDFCRKPNEMEDLSTDGKGIIFQWVLKEQDDKALDDLSGSGHG
jgi:hypothetical protein